MYDRGACETYVPMNESVKLTLSTTCCITGKTRSCRQSFASGHFDMMWASSGTSFSICAGCGRTESNILPFWQNIVPGIRHLVRLKITNRHVTNTRAVPNGRSADGFRRITYCLVLDKSSSDFSLRIGRIAPCMLMAMGRTMLT